MIIMVIISTTIKLLKPNRRWGQQFIDTKPNVPSIGERLTAMLPSLVGIQRPRTDVVVQPIVSANPNATNAAQSKRDQAAKAEQSDAEALAQSLAQKNIGWDIAPILLPSKPL